MSHRKAKAARANGAHSHGPVTDAGKQKSTGPGPQNGKLPNDPSIAQPQSPQRPPAPRPKLIHLPVPAKGTQRSVTFVG